MKLLIKLEDKYAEIFRVYFRKSRLRSVIGEMFLLNYLENFIPNGIDFHSHFIYFEDGNYHFSLKYFDTVDNLYIDRKTYHNHIAIRKSTSSNFNKESVVSYERRKKVADDQLDMFMRNEPTEPWSTRPLNHHFGMFGLHSDGDHINKFQWNDNIKVNAEDLVVNLRDYKNHTLNFNAVLYDKGNPAFITPENTFTDVMEKTIESDDLVVKFSMRTVFNPQ